MDAERRGKEKKKKKEKKTPGGDQKGGSGENHRQNTETKVRYVGT